MSHLLAKRLAWRVSAVLAVLWPAAALAADGASADEKGRIRMLQAGGEFHKITTDIVVATAGWKAQYRLSDAKDVRPEVREGRRVWRGTIPAGQGGAIAFEQTVTESDGAVRLAVRLTGQRDADLAGAFLFVHAPVATFGGGRCEVLQPAADTKLAATTMPASLPADHHFLRGRGAGLAMTSADGRTRLEIAFDRSLPFSMQDGRKWKSDHFDAYFELLRGKVASGVSAEAVATLKLAAPADDRPACLTLDASRRRFRLEGFGGNFCYGVDSPVTRHNLANIGMGYARVGMKLEQWEPANDNDSPDEINWPYFEARDRPGSQVHADFLLARRLAELKVPYVSSVWRVPEFVTAEPGRGPEARSRRLPPEKWPEVLESIGAYLLYAKRKYLTEPELFSFNESDIGCFVKMSGEEHRDWIKACGAHLAKLGLKTKMLLGDGTRGGGTGFVAAAAADEQAMRHVGAVAFHTWHHRAEDYRPWRELARSLQRPLIAAEVGPDAAAWKDGSFRLLPYFLDELRMYQEILLHAEAQALLEWEYTADYRMVEQEGAGDGTETLRPTARFWMIRQFANHTPRPAAALGTASDHPKVLFTAFTPFAEPAGDAPRLVLHVANVGAARKATLTGLPGAASALRAAQTTWDGGSEDLPPVAVRDGRAELSLPRFGLLTLTWAP